MCDMQKLGMLPLTENQNKQNIMSMRAQTATIKDFLLIWKKNVIVSQKTELMLRFFVCLFLFKRILFLFVLEFSWVITTHSVRSIRNQDSSLRLPFSSFPIARHVHPVSLFFILPSLAYFQSSTFVSSTENFSKSLFWPVSSHPIASCSVSFFLTVNSDYIFPL